MATEGTKLVMKLKDVTLGDKTINVTNPLDNVTNTQVETFLQPFNQVYDASYVLSTAYYEDVTHRALGTNA